MTDGERLPPRRAWRTPAAIAALLLALALAGAAAAYGAAIDGEFHFDDWTAIQANHRLRALDRVLDVSPLDLLGPARPVTEVTFALDYASAALAPTRYHLTSLALHLAAALLAFLLVRGVLAAAGHPRSAPLAAVAAGAFALHPIHAESVAYAAQRAEVLAAALGLGALLVLLRAEAAWPRPRAFALSLAAALLVALALGAKTVAVAYPVAFLLHRLVIGGPPAGETTPGARAARALALAAPTLVLAAASVARNLSLLGPNDSAGLSAGDLGPWRYLLTQFRVHWLYVRLLAWPAGLSVDRSDYSASATIPDVLTVAAGAGIAALVAAALLLWRAGERRPERAWARPAAFGILWWLLLLAPTSSFVPVLDLVAEHRTYLPSIGLLLAAVTLADAAVVRLLGHRSAAWGLAGALATLTALGVALGARAQVWRSDERLWADAAAKSKGSFRASANYAYALQSRDGEAALAEYWRAQLLARNSRDVAEIARNLSALYLDMGDAASALSVTDMGIAAAPGDAEIRNNRALAFHLMRRFAESVEEAEHAVALNALLPAAHDTLGLGLLSTDRAALALEEFRRAREIDPGESRYSQHEIMALARLGRREEACAVFHAIRARAGPALPEPVRQRAAALGCR